MKRITLTALSISLLIGLISTANPLHAQTASPFPELVTPRLIGDRLKKEWDSVKTIDDLIRTEAVQYTSRTRSSVFWTHLLFASDEPFAQIVGYACWRQSRGKPDPLSGLRVIISSTRPASPLLGMIYRELKSADWAKVHPDNLAAVLGGAKNGSGQLASALTMVPLELLVKWLEFEAIYGLSHPNAISLAVDELDGHRNELNESELKTWRESYLKLRGVPGLPAWTYVLLATPTQEADFAKDINLAFCDPDGDKLLRAVAVQRHFKFISLHREECLRNVVPVNRLEIEEQLSKLNK